jgi:hypothetical protein
MMDEPRAMQELETPKDLAALQKAPEHSAAHLIMVDALRTVESTLQALEKRREKNATATTESMHSVVFRIRALEQSQRGMQNQLQPLE